MPNDFLMIEDLHRLAHILLKHRAYCPDVPWEEFLRAEEPEQWSRLSVLADVLEAFYEPYQKCGKVRHIYCTAYHKNRRKP